MFIPFNTHYNTGVFILKIPVPYSRQKSQNIWPLVSQKSCLFIDKSV